MNEVDLLASAEGLSFSQQLESEMPVAIDLLDESLPWLISIGGLNQRMGMPVHEFVGVASSLATAHNSLFVRDQTRLWYQKGLPGYAESFVEAGDQVAAILDAVSAKRRVAVGSSAGGFAAIGWANPCEFDHVLAFSPQTSISPRAKLRDRRWMKFIWKSWVLQDRLLDVAPRALHDGAERVHVVFPNQLKADSFQAESIEKHPALVLDGRNSSDHSVVRDLKETGELSQLLLDALSPKLV